MHLAPSCAACGTPSGFAVEPHARWTIIPKLVQIIECDGLA